MRALSTSFLILAGFSGVAAAQRGAAPSFEGPRGHMTLDLSDGEPVSAFIEAGRALDLTDAQRQRLMEIRRLLRLQNKPFMTRLDSLRELAGIDLGDRERLRRRDEEALQRFNTWARPFVDSIRVNNDVARSEARALLTVDQRRRFDSIAVAAREARPRSQRRPPPR
ncbi:MAG: hypothetical protein IPK85_13510 [Gemmatimonadetes bacterium]|nr:hypothetical protein [Gemmatimonadota bacterium]